MNEKHHVRLLCKIYLYEICHHGWLPNIKKKTHLNNNTFRLDRLFYVLYYCHIYALNIHLIVLLANEKKMVFVLLTKNI